MLVVIAHIEVERVADPIIAGGLLVLADQEVLLDPPGADRVETADREQGREREIEQRHAAHGEIDDDVDGEDGRDIKHDPEIENVAALHDQRAGCLQERHEEDPGRPADRPAVEQADLPVRRQVGIVARHPEIGVMAQMMALEGGEARHELGDVAQNSRQPVGGKVLEHQPMGAFMNHHEQGVIGESADRIGEDQHQPPGGALDGEGNGELQHRGGDDDAEGPGIAADQGARLGMALENPLGADAVGNHGVRMHELAHGLRAADLVNLCDQRHSPLRRSRTRPLARPPITVYLDFAF